MNTRVLKSGRCVITSPYGQRNGGYHYGVDIVKEGYMLDYITAHSEGTVVDIQDGYSNKKGATGRAGWGNFVKLSHNGYYTLYAHLKKGLSLKIGDKVKKGDVVGYMSDSGDAYGGHLHFEVYRGNTRIDPTPYLNTDLPGESSTNTSETSHKYKIGDEVRINGVYVSSTSNAKLRPIKTKGKITRILEGARNPYLLENGSIGWVNDGCIVSTVENTTYLTVSNCSYLNLRTTASYGDNIYTSVKAGTKLEYHGMYNGWARVKYDGKTLYCGKSYLK